MVDNASVRGLRRVRSLDSRVESSALAVHRGEISAETAGAGGAQSARYCARAGRIGACEKRTGGPILSLRALRSRRVVASQDVEPAERFAGRASGNLQLCEVQQRALALP